MRLGGNDHIEHIGHIGGDGFGQRGFEVFRFFDPLARAVGMGQRHKVGLYGRPSTVLNSVAKLRS